MLDRNARSTVSFLKSVNNEKDERRYDFNVKSRLDS